jgi:16S rRNA G966 N2-methylase RsmD
MTASVKALGLDGQMNVLRKNISGWSRNHQDSTFDIVLADPPYDDIRPNVLERLLVHVKPEGLFVLSWPGTEPVRGFAGAQQVAHKPLGDIQLVFYRKIS